MSVGSPNLIKFSFSNLQHEPERARDAVSDLAWVPVCVHHLHSWQSVGQGRAMQSSKIGTTKPLCNEYGCQTKVETCEIPVCSVAETVHITARARSLRMAAQTPALHSVAGVANKGVGVGGLKQHHPYQNPPHAKQLPHTSHRFRSHREVGCASSTAALTDLSFPM
jgi:hypothetical protein